MLNLTQENINLYCAKSYDNPLCYSVAEFKQDLNRVSLIKRSITKYKLKGRKHLNPRLILNHIISFTNVFSVHHGLRILFYYIPEDYYRFLVPFLFYLGYINRSSVIQNINNRDIFISSINNIDYYIIEQLNQL